MFSTCPFVCSFVCLFFHQIYEHDSLNRFWHKWSTGQVHDMTNLGVRRSKLKVT